MLSYKSKNQRSELEQMSKKALISLFKKQQLQLERLNVQIRRDNGAVERFLLGKEKFESRQFQSAYRIFKRLLRMPQKILPKEFVLKELAKAAERTRSFAAASAAYQELSFSESTKIREWALLGLARLENKRKEKKQRVNGFLRPITNEESLPISHCSVCKLAIESIEDTYVCPTCGVSAHFDHLREWLRIKPYCPICRAILPPSMLPPIQVTL